MGQKVLLVRSILQPRSLAINVASYFSDANSIKVCFKKFSKLMADVFVSYYSRIKS